ncbi:MAG: hypothetical protein KIT14_09555 [bacterium]|nr:hypothetical protein [bacterium]
MPRVTHRRARVLSLVLAVLLLVPLFLEGHAHRDEQSREHCAVCVVTHAPALTPATPTSGGTVLTATTLRATTPPSYGGVDRPTPAGRGPPALVRRAAA